jgi:hypothetical protein
MIKVAALLAVAIAAVSLSACSAPSAGPAETTAPTATPLPAPLVDGHAILIETRITDARQHTGEVAEDSVLGEGAFCPGGTTTGSSVGPTITTEISCPDGTLTLKYAPTQVSLVQGAEWEVVSGTGSYEGLRGGGSMVAVFTDDDPDSGREIFTGIVGK